MTISIAQARQALEHLIALSESDHMKHCYDPWRTEKAKHGCLVLAWLERRQELMKAIDRLERERPDIADIFKAFPGAEIVGVRDMFFNGSGVEDDGA